MPAGRPYNEQNKLLTLNKEANKELNNIISNVKADTPIWSYPHLTFSPPNKELDMSDKKVWNHAIASEGRSIINHAKDDFRMITTA